MTPFRTGFGFATAALLVALLLAFPEAEVPRHDLPLAEGSVRFAVIGDSGTGGREQYEIAQRMAEAHGRFPFEFVLMLGDNLYGGERPGDYVKKFERPYQPLLQAGVRFHAVLGNHDEEAQRHYAPFNMGGRLYYGFSWPEHAPAVRFFALNTGDLDRAQLGWLEQALSASTERWKVAFFHHPIYSSGARHGSNPVLRRALEPLFVKYGVNVGFAGHEHVYERIRPQAGVAYFTTGAAAKLRKGNLRVGALTVAGFDRDRSFMLVEIAGDTLHFQAIARTGQVVDSGALPRVPPE